MHPLLTYLFNTFLSVFVIVDPFAVVPIYIAMTDRFSAAALRRIRIKASVAAAGILVVFALTGMTVFNVFGITIPAFQISGGILLFKFSLEQLTATRTRVKEEEKDEGLVREDISIFPLATPLLAGPGAISTVVLQSSKAESHLQTIGLVVAIVSALAVCSLVLRSAPYLYRILGKTGLNLITRLMGLILAAVAVQFILNGVRTALVIVQTP